MPATSPPSASVTRDSALIERLARSYGVQVEYLDASGEMVRSSDETLLAVVEALGAPLASAADLGDALAERERSLWARTAEPVAAVIAGDALALSLRVASSQRGRVRATLELEDGEQRVLEAELGGLPVRAAARVDGEPRCERRLALPDPVPLGYHELQLELGGERSSVLVIGSPRVAPPPANPRSWGAFLPLYAQHSAATAGVADIGDLEALLEAVTDLGGDLVGTTPLFAAFPDEPSPYAPASRLYWNELYADVDASPELADSAAARELLASEDYGRAVAALAEGRHVDYRASLALRRPVLEELAKTFFATSTPRRDAFEARLAATPQLGDYARFRATGEALGTPWPQWPQAAREGTLAVAGDDPVVRYYAYSQWLVDEQIVALSARDGAGLYLDQPIGVHAASFDTWRERESFALAASGGAPPDLFFTAGQDWGFPPLHPEGIREQRYRYPIACLRRIASHARSVRIDHVMGLHRMYWVPQGRPASEGAYVSYPTEELYAVLCLEAQRHGTTVVGEDLGTVPEEVRETMARRGIRRSHVLQFALSGDAERPVEPPPQASLASANTHDMAPFAAYWADAEPELHAAVVAYLQRRERLAADGEPDALAVHRALLEDLAASDAETVLVNLEDLWAELEPQNVPGTSGEDALNWRRRARYALEEMLAMPEVVDVLRSVDEIRRASVPA